MNPSALFCKERVVMFLNFVIGTCCHDSHMFLSVVSVVSGLRLAMRGVVLCVLRVVGLCTLISDDGCEIAYLE